MPIAMKTGVHKQTIKIPQIRGVHFCDLCKADCEGTWTIIKVHNNAGIKSKPTRLCIECAKAVKDLIDSLEREN